MKFDKLYAKQHQYEILCYVNACDVLLASDEIESTIWEIKLYDDIFIAWKNYRR